MKNKKSHYSEKKRKLSWPMSAKPEKKKLFYSNRKKAKVPSPMSTKYDT